MGLCDVAPACEVGHNHIKNCSMETIENAIKKKDTHPQIIDGISLDKYMKNGGYQILKNVIKENFPLNQSLMFYKRQV